MRVSKQQIVNGLSAYIREELLPKMGQDKAMQIVLDVAVNAVKANDKLIDKVFNSDYVKAFIQCDDEGKYEIDSLVANLRSSIEKYGGLPISIPPVPLIAPGGSTITLHAADINSIRDKIGGTDNA